MKIGVRLGLGFGAIVVIFGVAVFITTISLQVAKQNAARVERERFPQALLADKMAQAVSQIQKMLIGTALTLNIAGYDDVEAAAKEFQDGLNTFRQLYEREQNTAALDTIKSLETAFNRFGFLGKTMVDAYIINGVEQGNVQIAEFDQQAKVLENQMDQFQQDRIAAANTMTKGIVLAVGQVYRILVSLTGFAIVLSILIAFFITRGITRPVTRIVEVANAIAAGNLNRDIAITQHDEIGHLANAFRIMKITISDVLNEIEGLIHAVQIGKLDLRGNTAAFAGGWRELIVGVNSLTDALREKIAELHREINERKHAEAALRESEERLILTLEQTNVGLWELYPQTGDTYYSPSWFLMLGYDLNEFPAKYETWATLLHPDDRPQAEARLRQFLAPQEENYLADFRMRTKAGTWRWIAARGKAVAWDANGHVTRMVGIHLDITDRKLMEEQLKNQNILLEQAVQQKQREMEGLFERLLRQEKLATIGQMAGSIAHELRNPLGAVKQSAFYLKRLYERHQFVASNPKAKEHLDLIEAEIDTSERVIANLLQMTRMNSPLREHLDLRPLIMEAAERGHLPERVHLTLDLQPEPFLLWADPMQLRQVLINLLTNAMQAMNGEGQITIRAKQLTENESCVIEIDDTGTGIAPDALANVFEPLYTTKATGTGLGLSICKQIIESHHGQIAIRSQQDQGTTVTLVLPNYNKEG